MQQNQQSNSSAILDEFYQTLNTQRQALRKKPLSRDRIAEMISNELLQQNVQTTQDPSFQQIIQQYQVVSVSNFDYLYYDEDFKPKSFQFTGQEIRDNFLKVVDNMINGPYKEKLLKGLIQSHVGFAMSQAGNNNEKFQVVAFCTKKIVTLENVVYCNSPQDSGLIFGGKILDPNSKPFLFTINKCCPNQIVIGPNLMQFHSELGEVRIQIPDNYEGINIPDLLANSQQPNIISLFLTNVGDNSFCFGQGQNLDQTFNQYNNYNLAFNDVMIEMNSLQQVNGKLSQLVGDQNLFQNQRQSNPNQQSISNFNRSQTTQQSGPVIRTTKAMQHRQALAQNNRLTSNAGNIRQSTTTFQNQKTPLINRTQAFTNSVNSIQPSQLAFNTNQNKPAAGLIVIAVNENKNPNNIPKKFPPFNFGFNNAQNNNQNNFQTQTTNVVRQSMITNQNFNGNNNGFQNNFNSNNNKNDQTMNMSFQPSNQSAFQKPNFTPSFNNQASSNFQNNPFSSNNNTQNQGFKPVSNSYQNPFTNKPNQNAWANCNNNFPQNNNQFNFTQQQNSNNNNNGNNNFNNNQFNKQPTIRFISNQTQNQNQQPQQNQQNSFNPQYNVNNNTWNNQQAQQSNFSNLTNNFLNQNQNPQNNQQIKQGLIFSDLSLIDQEVLKGYLKELSEFLSSDQIAKITAIMLTEPQKFFEYYKTAIQQLQQAKLMGSNKSVDLNLNIPGSTSNVAQQQDNSSQRLREIDDLALFLLTLPETLQKTNESKYKQLMQLLNQNQITPLKVLSKLLIRKRQPINESFKSLYESNSHTDLVLQLRSDEYICHQIVFQTCSDYLKKAIKECHGINRYDKYPKLIAPDWMDQSAFKLFMLYSYTGKVGTDGNYKQLTHQQILNLLRIGNFFFIEYLQEFLIAQVIIPEMSPLTAVLFLKETISNNENRRKSCTNAWEYLKHYSQFYLTKHLPSLLRTNPSILYELDSTTLRNIIDQSLLFVVDGSKDLESILKFTADIWAEKSITNLYRKSQRSMDCCSAYDYQIIPQISEFLKQTDPKTDYKCPIIKSQQVVDAKSIPQDSKYKADHKKPQAALDSTFIQGIEDLQNKKDNDLSNWKPSSNVLQDYVSEKDLFSQKEPQQTITFKMENLKQDFEKNKSISLIYKAYDFGRRSWHVKMDIDSESNVSVWILERGNVINEHSNQQPQIGLNIPIKFSSILFQFELIDAAFGEYKSLIFHTFSHDSNQIIGHEKFINLSQLKDRNEINLKVYMKEFILHSCLTHHICQNFQDYYQQDLKKIDIAKHNYASQKNNYLLNQKLQSADYDVLNMPFYCVFQYFQSNELKIDEENLALGFLFYYTKVQQLNNNIENMKLITNMISQAVRFPFVSTRKLLSALRDNENLRNSTVFRASTLDEFYKRVGNQNSIVLNIKGSSSKNQAHKAVPRKYYDNSKVNSSKNQQQQSFTSGQEKINFVDDVMEWLRTSKHNNDNESFLYQEVKKWQNLYYDEKAKLASLISQYANYKQRSPLKFEQKRHQRRSLSNDKLFETQDSVNYQRAQTQGNQPVYTRARTPPRKAPTYPQRNNQNEPLPTRNPTYRQNNSFDQSYYFPNNQHNLQNDTLRPLNQSFTRYADTKIKSNQYADFSMLLNNLERSGQKRQNQQNQDYVPYYRKNQGNTRSKSQTDHECIIF
eukprot:403332320